MNDPQQYDEAYYREVKRKKTIMISVIVSVLIIFGISGGVLWYITRTPESSLTANTLGATTDENPQEIIRKVGSHMTLPPGEIPKVVTVTNVAQMKKTQPFFTSASNGDKLLIYSTKVVLYSPISDRIIDIAQIRFTPENK
jgi:hypothetical protein